MMVEFKLFNPMLKEFGLPEYQSDGAAAMDIRALMDVDRVEIAPGATHKFRAGFGFHIARPDYAAFILPRSGSGTRGANLKNTLGLIDSDYQGELVCTAINTNPPGSSPIVVEHGERIFQLLFLPVVRVEQKWVDCFSAASSRGDGGLGSTGRR